MTHLTASVGIPDLPTATNGGLLVLALILAAAWWLAMLNKEADR